MENLQICDILRQRITRRITTLDSFIRVEDTIFFVEHGKLFCFVKTDIAQPLCVDKTCITELVYITAENHIGFGTGTEFIYVNVETYEVAVVVSPECFTTATWSPNKDRVAICDKAGRITCYQDCFRNPFPDNNYEVPTNTPLGNDVTQVNIVWKFDSSEFCVTYFDDSYKLRVYGNTGEIFIDAFEVPNMLPHVAWRENFLIVPRRNEHKKIMITMYERHGFFDHEFKLSEDVLDVGMIKWNRISGILAVHVYTAEGSFINFYLQNNVTYLLKQQIVSTNDNQIKIFEITESTRNFFSLYVVTPQIISYLKIMLKIQTGVLPSGIGFRADVDGKQLQLNRIEGDTFFKNKPIHLMTMAKPINQVEFHHSSLSCIVVDSYGNIYFYTNVKGVLTKRWKKLGPGIPAVKFQPIQYYNYCFLKENIVLAVHISNFELYDLYELNLTTRELALSKLDQHIKYMQYIPEYDQVLKFKEDGIVYLNDRQHISPIHSDLQKMGHAIVEGEFYLVTLDVRDNLRINSNLLCTSVTSFLLHEGYLYITAFIDKLYSIRLDSENMRNICNNSLSTLKLFTRVCEKRSILLTGIPNEKYIVIYNIRGSTESILCRNVDVDVAVGYVKSKKWNDAFQYIRMQHLDFNLLVDVDPDTFLRNVENFVTILRAPNLLYLFVLAITDVNCFTTTYANMPNNNIIVLPNKKKLVSEAILQVIKHDVRKYVTVCVIASQAIGGIPAAVGLLYYLFTTYDDVESVLIDGVNSLILYFPMEDIQQACIATGNIDFVENMFDKMDIDPKTYEDLITEVRESDGNPYRQGFLMNDFIDNYAEALNFKLVGYMYSTMHYQAHNEDDSLTAAIEYAVNHGLVTQLYKYNLTHKLNDPTILTLYTEDLCSAGRYQEAALIYSAHSRWFEAFEAFTACGLWHQALQTLQHVEGEKREHLVSVARTLRAQNNYKDAAHVYEIHLSEPRLAISCLISAKLFKEAVRVALKFGLQGTIEDRIRHEYLVYYNTLMEKVEESSKLFKKHCERLYSIRSTPADVACRMDVVYSQKCAESVTGSLASGSTLRSKFSLTSGRSRKLEKKKQDLRHGGAFENIALMRSLHNTIREAYILSADIREMCDLLISIERDGFPKAKILQNAHDAFLHNITENLLKIWPANLNAVEIKITPEISTLRQNMDQLEMKYRYPPDPVNTKWRLPMLDELVD